MEQVLEQELVEIALHPEPIYQDSEKFEFADKSVYAMARKLISLHSHELGHLISHPVLFIFNKKPKKNKGKTVLGYAQLCDELFNMYTGYEYKIYLDFDYWTNFPEKREALLTHEMLHCGYDYEKEKPFLRSHDLEEFNTVAQSYGYWRQEVKEFDESLEKS